MMCRIRFTICLTLVLCLLFTGCAGTSDPAQGRTVQLFFADEEGGDMPDAVLFSQDALLSEEEDSPSGLIKLLLSGSAPDGYVNLLSLCSLLSCRQDDGTLVVSLSSVYSQLSPLQLSLADACLVLTVCSAFPDIQQVQILCEGLPPTGREDQYYTPEDFHLEMLDLQPLNREITIWFGDYSGTFFTQETRQIIVRENEELERYVLEELITGPKDTGSSALLPQAETLLESASCDGNICYVNLSSQAESAFHQAFPQEAAALMSVVQSLTELDGIDAVQFLVDGAIQETFCCLPISAPIQRDTTLSGPPNTAAGETAVTLYYTAPDGSCLIPVQRVLTYQEGISTERSALESLLYDSRPFWAESFVPEGTEIIDFRIENGICYVEFSPAFLYARLQTAEGEARTIQNIVASLTAFSAIDGVQISIQGILSASYQYYQFDAPLTDAAFNFYQPELSDG